MKGRGNPSPLKENVMNIYPAEFLDEHEVKEVIFKTKTERDTEVRQLRKNGWEVTTKKYHFDGDERYFITAIRRKEQRL
jgi:hypothetical protein